MDQDVAMALTAQQLSRVWLGLAAVLLSGWLGGCGAVTVAAPPDAYASVASLLAVVEGKANPLRTLRMRSTVEVYASGERVKARQVVVAQMPDRFRFETLSPLDTSLSVVACDGGRLSLYDLQAGRFLSGAATASNIAALTRIPLTAPDLVRLLMGGAPALSEGDGWAMAWDERLGGYRLSRRAADGSLQELWLRHGSGSLLALRVTDGAGRVQLRVTTAAPFEVSDGGQRVTLSRRLELELPQEKTQVLVEVGSAQLGVELDAMLFELPVPRGMEAEPLGVMGR
jgi:outer membrane lipoprotein-sorting protein